MSKDKSIREGQLLIGSLFNEPMRVETIRSNRPDTWVAGLVGTQSERFRKVKKVAHYYLSIDAMTQPMQVREEQAPYNSKE